MKCGQASRMWRQMLAMAASKLGAGEWTRSADAAGIESVPARAADAGMRKATKFVMRNEGERWRRKGLQIPERRNSLAGRGARSIAAGSNFPGQQPWCGRD